MMSSWAIFLPSYIEGPTVLDITIRIKMIYKNKCILIAAFSVEMVEEHILFHESISSIDRKCRPEKFMISNSLINIKFGWNQIFLNFIRKCCNNLFVLNNKKNSREETIFSYSSGISYDFCVWKLKKLWFVKYIILKQTPLILKRFPLECSYLKRGISICLLACKYIFHWMNEWIFIMNVEQYLLSSRGKRLPETRLFWLFFMYRKLEMRKKDEIYS